jgi:hypothetical protein
MLLSPTVSFSIFLDLSRSFSIFLDDGDVDDRPRDAANPARLNQAPGPAA